METSGEGWEACYDLPQAGDVYDVQLQDDTEGEEASDTKHLEECPACGGFNIEHLGTLGTREHYRCRSCGAVFSPND